MTSLYTASIDDLKYLKGIETQRAISIITLRYGEKNDLTMEYIEENLHYIAFTIHKFLCLEIVSSEISYHLI